MSKKIVNSGRFLPGNIKSARDITKEFDNYCNLFFPQCPYSKRMRFAADIFKEYFVNGAWINNYFQYEFYKKSRKERYNI